MNGHEWNPLREESCGRKANSVERVPDGDDKWIWMSPRLTAAKLILAFGREEKSTQSITATETDLTSVYLSLYLQVFHEIDSGAFADCQLDFDLTFGRNYSIY